MKKRLAYFLIMLFVGSMALASCRTNTTQTTTISTNSDPSTAITPGATENSAPTTEPTTSPVFFEQGMFLRAEPYPYSKFYGGVNGKIISQENIVYHFDALISDNDCLQALEYIEKSVHIIEDTAGTSDGPCEIYILSNEYAPRTYEHKLYVGIQNIHSQDMLLCLIQAVYGYEVNYGLTYALSCDVGISMGIFNEEVPLPLSDALALVEAEPAFLDMNYACFSAFYADEQKIEQVKSLSRHFYSQLQAEERHDLFKEFTDDKYCAYLSNFLANHDLPTYDNSDLAGTVFYNGGEQTEIAWKNHIGEFYVEKGYTVTYHDIMFSEDMVNSGYTNLRRIVVDYIAQAEYAHSKLDGYKVNDEPLYILFMEDRKNSIRYGAVYVSEKNEIRMFAVSPFLHEYTHYLTERYLTGWKCELLPNYYSNDTISEHINYTWYSDVLTYSSLDPSNPNDVLKYELFEGVKANLGHTFDWTSREDFQYLLDAYIVKRGWLDRVTSIDSGVATKTSFFHFLVSAKDEQTATTAVLENAPEIYYGYTWFELIDLWKQDLQNRFAWVNS